ncbi:hypothetical protein HYH03_010322 [Edaphochlamys debaryana]|uniref:DUF7794 domain-containing protein n=1 Tax=Edaphochlamys debaryana TaxID=47281 RepID=A0A835XZJ8_9CHLO|nr:hypothetical protein HYH03_010322 [Edaphochlamys debaryana]|eukprot:KAG2491316.1 hypothetical protein HYH03_010322 [Edaphochlamys debaryana]
MRRILLPILAVCLLAAAARASPIVLLDSKQSGYLQSGPSAALGKGELGALVGAATGLTPGAVINEELSKALEGILKPRALAKPRAFVSVNVAGLDADALTDLASERVHRTVELTGPGCSAKATVDGLTRIAAANPTAKLFVVDHSGVQDCEGDCVAQHLSSASADCGLDLSALDMSKVEDKLFATELASTYAGLKSLLLAAQKRSELGTQEDVELYEVSVMGLRALVTKYGPGSPAAEAAKAAVQRLIKWAVESLDAAYQGDVVYQILALPEGPARTATMSQLISWKDQTRRQLQEAVFPPVDQVAASKQFSAKAAGYAAFVLLLYFSLAAVWCMCNMPFKQDTLLYGSKKDQ